MLLLGAFAGTNKQGEWWIYSFFSLSILISKKWKNRQKGLIKAKHEKCVSRQPPNNIYPTCKFVRAIYFNCLPNVCSLLENQLIWKKHECIKSSGADRLSQNEQNIFNWNDH